MSLGHGGSSPPFRTFKSELKQGQALEINVNQTSSYKVEITVKVPAEKWRKIVDKAYKKYQSSLRLDGFRPGRIPLSVVKKMFGKGIEAEAADEALKTFYREAIDEADINPIAPGDITDVDYGDDQPFVFKAAVEVMPKLEIQKLEEMSTYLHVVQVNDDDAEAGIQVLREDAAILYPQETPAEEGNVLIVDVQEIDQAGIPLLTHKWSDITLEIGKGDLGSEVDEMLIRGKIADEITISYNSDETDDKGNPKKVHYKYVIKDIKRKELPEVKDEFAQSVHESFKTVEDLKQGLLQHLQQQANSRAKVHLFFRLADFLIEHNRIEVPPAMLEIYMNNMLDNARKKNEVLDEVDFKNKNRSPAIRNLKWFILRRNLIDQFNLGATDDEVETEIQTVMQRSDSDPQTMRKQFQEEKNRDRLQDDIEERKVLEFLVAKTKVTPREISYREFIEADKN